MSDTQAEPIMDVKQIEKIILNEIPQSFDFIEREDVPSLHPEQLQQPGRAWRKLKLSSVRGWVQMPQRSEALDESILDALDNICQKGRLLIFDIRLHRDLENHDALLSCEIGLAMKTYTGPTPPVPEIVRLYSKEPLTTKERSKPHVILDPKERVEKIRAQRDAYLRAQFGGNSREVEIEKELRRIDREAEIEFRKAVMAIAKNTKKND